MKSPIEGLQIPQDWQIAPISSLADFRRGISWRKQDESPPGEGTLVISIPNIKDGWIDYQSKFNHYIDIGIPASKLLREGDIVFVGSSGSIHNVGRNARFSQATENSIAFASFTFTARPNPSVVDSHFFYFLVNSDLVPFQAFCKRAADGKFNFQLRDFASRLVVPLPPLVEQKAIARELAAVKRAIEAQEQIIQITTELKKALMQKLFSEGFRGEPQKETEIGLVPESWGVVPLSDVCRFQSGGTPSKQNPDFWQGTIPWVSPKDMKRPRLNDVADHISIEALESGSKLAPAGSVFVVVRGMILAKTVPVALATVPMAINQDIKAIVPGAELRSDFLLYALEAFRESMFKKVGRSGHGTATLMGHEVAAFKIPLPDMQTQEEIAYAFQNIERKKELHEQKYTSIQALFSTLLHELMAAKTRVNQLNLNTELIP